MPDPVTTNRGLTIPATGSDVGSWGPIVNGNFAIIDTLSGGLVTKSLTNANIALNATDIQNKIVRLTGTLTGNVVITCPQIQAVFTFENLTTGSFYVQLTTGAGGGANVGVPQGMPTDIFTDGTNVKFRNPDKPGTFWDYAGSSVPLWVPACTTLPYLVCDGTATYLINTYPALAAILGTTYGGNGVTTFGVPDLRSRVRLSLDTNPGSGFAARLTAGVSGINPQVLGAAGGDQNMPLHNHAVTDSGHSHFYLASHDSIRIIDGAQGGVLDVGGGAHLGADASATQSAVTGLTVSNAGTGTGANVQPALVAGLTLLKT